MSRQTLKVLATVVGAISIAVVLFCVAVLTRSVAAGSSVDALMWIVPIAAGALVGAVSWALLAPARLDTASGRQRCDSCGALVLDTWRICPHCGHLLADVSDIAESAPETSAAL